jgi:Acetyltransferase (GNAT) domain
LRRTYGYDPVAYTTSPPDADLTNGLVCCRVESRLTGRRLVSLPFSDHCEPLVDSEEARGSLLAALASDRSRGHWRYVEIRPLRGPIEPPVPFGPSGAYYVHRMDLRPPIDVLRRAFHKSNVQAKIRRAEREGLTCEVGRSEALVSAFYRLLLLTCRRRRLPPQPIAWFHHLIDCLGDAVTIHVASKAHRPVSSIITLTFKRTLVYKYGCSDPRFYNLGGTQLLLWRAIQAAKHAGLQEFDLGRSDLDAGGLVAFKDRWGTTRSMINYFRCPAPTATRVDVPWSMRIAKPLFARMPDPLLIAAGRTLYRHMG